MTYTIALGIAVVGILCFIAPRFDIIPSNYGTFAGIACMLISGVFFTAGGMKAAGRKGGTGSTGT